MASSLTPILLAKPLPDLGGKTALARVIESCRDAALSRPIVVLGSGTEAGKPPLPGVLTAPSLREGLELLPADARGFLLFPAEYPLVTWRELVLLEERFEHDHRHRIYVPTFEGRHGHPVAFDRSLAGEILALEADQPVRLVLRRDPARVMEVPVENPWVCRALDTPENLAHTP